MKTYLVKYNHTCGEFEFSGHTLISLLPKQQASTLVHAYFKDYYGKENLEHADRCSYYIYNGGQVAVKDIVWTPISESDAEVLRAHNL